MAVGAVGVRVVGILPQLEVLAAGLLLLQVSFMGYRHEGFTWLVTGLALLGAGATAWGMARLLALLRRP